MPGALYAPAHYFVWVLTTMLGWADARPADLLGDLARVRRGWRALRLQPMGRVGLALVLLALLMAVAAAAPA